MKRYDKRFLSSICEFNAFYIIRKILTNYFNPVAKFPHRGAELPSTITDLTPILRYIESKVRQDGMLSGKARRRTHARENTENERLRIRSFHQRADIETAMVS